MRTEMNFTIYESPTGPLTLIAGPDGLRGLHFPGRGPSKHEADHERRDPVLAAAAEQLDAYFAGELRQFELELDLVGTLFQRRVWDALRQIPYGITTTYGTLAHEIGAAVGRGDFNPRAVGAAVGRTPVPIIVPCHRVIGSDGSLTGYGGGLHRKRALLDFERSGGERAALDAGWTGPQLALL
jgi:methylated-DNA-[protein]-cysteine S-methyltransferase